MKSIFFSVATFVIAITSFNTTVEAKTQPAVDVFDLQVLADLENQGLDFGSILGAPQVKATADLAQRSTGFKSVEKVLRQDLLNMESLLTKTPFNTDDGHEFVIEQLANTTPHAAMIEAEGDAPRRFHPDWLRSKIAYFKLVGVINRVDRKDFDEANNSCGESRLIYRLAYRSEDGKLKSYLPFFVNMVYLNKPSANGNCSDVLKKWITENQNQSPAGNHLSAQEILKGPFAKDQLRFKQLEINFQSLRFTAGYMKDFGGQAMYMLRIFANKNTIEGLSVSQALTPVALENTPDVLTYLQNPSLKKKLVEFISDRKNLEKIDKGTIVIPDLVNTDRGDVNTLARKAISYTTMGHARLGNKPFSEILSENDLVNIDLSRLQFIKSKTGLIERLNNLTCMGCHQSGGTAGFHILGQFSNETSGQFNQVAIPFSSHYYAERIRRQAYSNQIIEGREPNQFRPHSLSGAAPKEENWAASTGTKISYAPANMREACLVNFDHFSSGSTCGKDMDCVVTAKFNSTSAGISPLMQFGECMPRASSKDFVSGLACRTAEITGMPTNQRSFLFKNAALLREKDAPINFMDFMDVAYSNSNSVKNGLEKVIQSDLRGMTCGNPKGGVPRGRTSKPCDQAKGDFQFKKFEKLLNSKSVEDFRNGMPSEFCAIRGGSVFETCAGKEDATSCLENEGTARGMLDTCYEGKFCREDYICQALPESIKHTIKDGSGLKIVAEVSEQDRKMISMIRKSGVGFCTPTYFVFNMRADGHPHPLGGKDEASKQGKRRGGYGDKRGHNGLYQ